jgi:putative heme iron utilization protein
VLSTLSKRFDGHPFGSIAPYLTDHDGSVLLFISGLAEHTKNLLRDPRVSLITHDQNDPRIQTQGRVTLIGDAHPLDGREPYEKRWLRHFPENAHLFELGDFSFFRIVPQAVRHVAGFGQARWINSHFCAAPSPLMTEAEGLLKRINVEYPHVIEACLQHQSLPSQHWELVDIDCDGATVMVDQKLLRLNFPTIATDAETALNMLHQLAETAAP